MLWRPSKLIEPCLPSPAKAPPSGPGWLHEIKHDGFRILARRESADVRLITRAGNDFSGRFPFIAIAVSKLPVRSCLIDGEAIVCDENGLADFELIRGHGTAANAVHCAFDLRWTEGTCEGVQSRSEKGYSRNCCAAPTRASYSTNITRTTARLYFARLAGSDARALCRSGSALPIVGAAHRFG